jgi:hypothetical protein
MGQQNGGQGHCMSLRSVKAYSRVANSCLLHYRLYYYWLKFFVEIRMFSESLKLTLYVRNILSAEIHNCSIQV